MRLPGIEEICRHEGGREQRAKERRKQSKTGCSGFFDCLFFLIACFCNLSTVMSLSALFAKVKQAETDLDSLLTPPSNCPMNVWEKWTHLRTAIRVLCNLFLDTEATPLRKDIKHLSKMVKAMEQRIEKLERKNDGSDRVVKTIPITPETKTKKARRKRRKQNPCECAYIAPELQGHQRCESCAQKQGLPQTDDGY